MMTDGGVSAVGTIPHPRRFSRVGRYKITVINEEFSSSTEFECRDDLAARKHAIDSALAIGAEQIAAGKPYFGAHITISEGDTNLLQLVVSAGASPLKSSEVELSEGNPRDQLRPE